MNLNSFGSSPLLPVFNPTTQAGNVGTAPGGGLPSVSVYGGTAIGHSTVEAKIAAGGVIGIALLLALGYFWTRGANA